MAANMKIIHAINQMSIAFKPEALGEVSLEKNGYERLKSGFKKQFVYIVILYPSFW